MSCTIIHNKAITMRTIWKKLRADLATGLLFLIPMSLVLYILYRLWNAVHDPVRALAERFGVAGFLKVYGLMVVSLLVLVLLVLLVGRLVRGHGTGKVRRWTEEQVLSHMPGYTYIRIIMESKLGLADPPMVRPTLLRTGDGWQPAFLVETLPEGRCVVYLPDVPMGTTGTVLIVEEENVQALSGSVSKLDHALRGYGKGLGALLQ